MPPSTPPPILTNLFQFKCKTKYAAKIADIMGDYIEKNRIE